MTREVLRKSGDRTRATRCGAGDGHGGPERAAGPGRRAHERRRVALHAAAGSRSRTARPHRRVGASPSPVWRRHDLPEAAPGGSPRQSQPGGPPGRRGAFAGAAAAPQQVPLAGRQPIARPHAPTDVWSPDFVIDAEAPKGACSPPVEIVHDATTEAVAVAPAGARARRPTTAASALTDRAGQAAAERVCRIVQRPVRRRMPQ